MTQCYVCATTERGERKCSAARRSCVGPITRHADRVVISVVMLGEQRWRPPSTLTGPCNEYALGKVWHEHGGTVRRKRGATTTDAGWWLLRPHGDVQQPSATMTAVDWPNVIHSWPHALSLPAIPPAHGYLNDSISRCG